MRTPWSQASRPSKRTNPSAICTVASRSDFTSEPRRTMPASTVSEMS
jgi:hypothetical protein